MTAEMERVQTAQITYAVRNTSIDGMEIHEGDIMAIGDHGMLAVDTSVLGAAKAALEAMLNEEQRSWLLLLWKRCDRGRCRSLQKAGRRGIPG